MIMKCAVAAVLAAAAIFICTSAIAGSVDIGYVDKAGVNRWISGEQGDGEAAEIDCAPAKFQQISNCPTIIIFNHSPNPVVLSFTSTNEVFSVGEHEALVVANGYGPQPCYQDINRSLQPGHLCYAPVQFWPRTGDPQHATIHVTATGSKDSANAYFKAKGTSNYPPQLQAAEVVRERHATELMKDP
jgi:hypothetical protein